MVNNVENLCTLKLPRVDLEFLILGLESPSVYFSVICLNPAFVTGFQKQNGLWLKTGNLRSKCVHTKSQVATVLNSSECACELFKTI